MAASMATSRCLTSIRSYLLNGIHWPLYIAPSQQKIYIALRRPCTIYQCSSFHLSSTVFKKRKTAEERKAPRLIQYSPKAKSKTIEIWKNITVADLAKSMEKDVDHVFEVMMYVDNSSDYDREDSIIDDPRVVNEIVKKSGLRFRIVAPPDTSRPETKDRDVVRQPPAEPSAMMPRPPVVTVMGHVDHGKTTLLDALRHTSVVSTEFGGITQHIGAFSVRLPSGEPITFLDTPGHAAFSAMRARGANVTDLVVLVVAADDGVMEQTVESIRMAREANVPIIVAINKVDKPEADVERTQRLLAQHGVQVEAEGGDVQAVPVSALRGTNLDALIETIVLQAELMNLTADPRGLVEAVVVESCTDPGRGKLATVIVKRGTLRKGSVLVAGTAWAKVRSMFDETGANVAQAPPSTPVEIIGWRSLPSAGDEVLEVESEKRANEVIRWRESIKLQEKQESDQSVVDAKHQEHLLVYKAELQRKRQLGRYRMRREGPREKEKSSRHSGPRLSIVVKADVDGSAEAILDVLGTYEDDVCPLSLVSYGVGDVCLTDIELAETFEAIVYAFNVKTPPSVVQEAKGRGVRISNHNVIYRMVDEIKKEISARLPLKEVEEILGEANVLQEFEVTEGKRKVQVAGCRCTKGILKKSGNFRLKRGQDIIHEGSLSSMRHLKNEVDSIKTDVECGLRLSDTSITFLAGDTLICYERKKVEQETEWDPGF